MTRARNIAGFSTITTTPSPVHVGPIGVLTATRIDGEFNQVDLATRNITAAGIAATNLQVSGITTGLNVSGIITAQNGINFNGTSTGFNASGVSTITTLDVNGNGDISGNLTVGGNATIAGVLTYEDVTRVDSVGVVTARGLSIFGNTTGLQVASGISTFQAITGTTGTFTGNVTVTGTQPSILLTDTDNNPDYLIKNGNGEFNIQDTTASANRLSINSSGNVVVGSDLIIPDKIVHASDTNTTIRFPAADTITAETGGNEVLRIDSSQRLLLGTSTSAGANRQFQIVGTTGTTAAMSICRNTNNNDGVTVDYVKSRNATYGSSTIVQDDDVIAKIQFRADDGADYVSQAASITAAIDGTPGSNDMPGRLVFSTTCLLYTSPSPRDS